MPWTEQTAQWLCRAAEHTGFPGALAALLLPHLAQGATLCDLGCGLGLTDLALAPHLERIDGLDRDPLALTALEQLRQDRGIANLHPVLGDAAALTGTWDHLLAISFGRAEQLPDWLTHCRRSLLLVVRADAGAAFGPGHAAKRNTVSGTAQFLAAHGLPYSLTDHTLEYGQPLRDRQEAAAFVRAYATAPVSGLEAYLDRALVPSGLPDFPWYLPHAKRFGLFVIPAARKEAAF